MIKSLLFFFIIFTFSYGYTNDFLNFDLKPHYPEFLFNVFDKIKNGYFSDALDILYKVENNFLDYREDTLYLIVYCNYRLKHYKVFFEYKNKLIEEFSNSKYLKNVNIMSLKVNEAIKNIKKGRDIYIYMMEKFILEDNLKKAYEMANVAYNREYSEDLYKKVIILEYNVKGNRMKLPELIYGDGEILLIWGYIFYKMREHSKAKKIYSIAIKSKDKLIKKQAERALKLLK